MRAANPRASGGREPPDPGEPPGGSRLTLANEEAVEVRPRTTGEILDDAWRLALADAPLLLVLNGLFLVPALAVLLLLLTQPVPAGAARIVLPLLAAVLIPLTGVGSGACQELFRLRAERKPVKAMACLGAALRRGVAHSAARCAAVLGVFGGGVCFLVPGLGVWMTTATAHALIAGARGGAFADLHDLGREGRFAPGKTAAVVLSRAPLLLFAFVNLHLLVQAILWVAGNLAGFDVGFVSLQLDLGNRAYFLAVLFLSWLLLAPSFEAANYLLYLDTRTRQEGLDLQYRVQRTFPALDRSRMAVTLVLLGGLLLASPVRAAETPLDAVRVAREGIDQIRREVREADASLGGDRWEGRVRALGRRLERSGNGDARRFRWYADAIEGFGRRGHAGALEVLDDLHHRLELLEDSLARSRPERPGRDGRAPPSEAEVKRMLRGGDDAPDDAALDEKAEEQPRQRRREEVEPDDPGERKGGRKGPGLVAPAPGGGFGVFGWLLLLGLALVVLVVGGFLFFSSRQAQPRAAETKKGEAAPDMPVQPQERSAAEWWRQADEMAARGEYLEAVRAVYLAVLSLLHRQQLLRYEPTRTNGEYVRMVKLAPEAPPPVVRPFEGLTDLFELKWYGERACEGEEYRTCRGLAEEIQEALRP
jgi:hypothetical protein